MKDKVLTKSQLRNRILLRLKKQKEEDYYSKSSIIRKKLFRKPVFKKAKILMCYVSLKGEVDTREVIKQAQKLGKIIVLPVCKKDKTISPCLFSEDTKFLKGCYGVAEPAIKNFVDVKKLDLVIVPGIAFDKRGNRLGRGKGCYDMFLDGLPKRTPSIGLAFDFQVLPYIPTSTRDVRVREVIFA